MQGACGSGDGSVSIMAAAAEAQPCTPGLRAESAASLGKSASLQNFRPIEMTSAPQLTEDINKSRHEQQCQW